MELEWFVIAMACVCVAGLVVGCFYGAVRNISSTLHRGFRDLVEAVENTRRIEIDVKVESAPNELVAELRKIRELSTRVVETRERRARKDRGGSERGDVG